MIDRGPAKVAIAHTGERHRSQERVLSLVESALLQLGGISQFIAPGATVLIKPNQTVYYSAEEGCTTDPLVVGALIQLAKRRERPECRSPNRVGDFSPRSTA